MADFFLDPAERLTDQERALAGAMLRGLVASLADELRVRMPDDLARASERDGDALFDELAGSGLLARPELFGLLLRRAALARLTGTGDGQGAAHLQKWTGDADEGVASAAMAVVLARAAGRPRLSLGDCEAETAMALTYGVAAALGRGTADEAVVAAAVDLLGRHDEGERLEALEARLMLALHRAGRIDAGMLVALAASGEAGLLAEALARLAGVPGEAAWEMLAEAGAGECALLLRMAGLPREAAARVLAALGHALPADSLAAEMRAFDRRGDGEVDAERERLRLPPGYRTAAAALEAAHGS